MFAHLSNKQYTLTEEIPCIELTYDQVRQEHIVYHLQKQEDPYQFYKIHLSDGYCILFYSDVVFHLIMWRILHYFNLEVSVHHHIFKRIAVSRSSLAQVQSKLVDYIYSRIPDVDRSAVNRALFDTINYLYNFIVSELNQYVETISILGIAKIMSHPQVAEVIHIHYNPTFGTQVLEKKIEQATKEMVDLLTNPDILHPNDNELFYYLKTKQININQLAQMLIMYGPRTDIDDTIIMHPVLGNSVNGINDLYSMVVDSLSSKKTALYQKSAVSDSQYTGRKQHLLSSSIMYHYPGDCGSTVPIEFDVKKSNYKSIVGIYRMDDKNQLHPISEEEAPTLIGKRIRIRNPITCKYTDGVCSTCGGTIMRNIRHDILLGQLSAIQFVDPTTQKILSAKHLIKTKSILYELSEEASYWFQRSNVNEIRWNQNIRHKLKHYKIGVAITDLTSLNDIRTLEENVQIKLERYSNIKKVYIKDVRNNNIVEIDLENNGIVPNLTKSFLIYMRDYMNSNRPMESDYIFWLPAEETDNFNIFATLVVNDSVKKFVADVSLFLRKEIVRYRSAHDALNAFCDLIYTNVAYAHVTHLSTVLKGYLVTSPINYKIPVVTDPRNVMFRSLSDIIASRTIGAQLAFERHKEFVYSLDSYIVPRCHSVFDLFMGMLPDKMPNKYLVPNHKPYIE